MHVAFVIGGSLVVVGGILYLHHLLTGGNKIEHETPTPEQERDSECCGMHITCERDSLSPVFADEIVYFDDEELDEFIGREADNYTSEESDCFREVLFTLRPEEIAPWARSVQQRGINMPVDVRDELILMVQELRNKKLSVSLTPQSQPIT